MPLLSLPPAGYARPRCVLVSWTPFRAVCSLVTQCRPCVLRSYAQALACVKEGRARCDELGIPCFRPHDYYAEMMKDDTHMNKVRWASVVVEL